MAEVKSNLVDLTVVYSKLNAELDENISRLTAGAIAVENYNKKISNVPSQFQKALVDIKQKTDAVATSTNSLIQTEKRANQERLKELQIQKQREVAVDKYNAQLAKEEAKLASASNAYNRLQAELTKLNTSYQNLAVRQAQGATLTRVEAEQKDYLAKRIKNVDTTMKAVDASMGKYQRNVGNYASGFNPLSNSINQLGREMPAFANSVQTGFMAISNNLPIFFDAMGQVIAQNKQLQAEGKPTKSVLSQLASSLFSFQTLLSVGVTLLTVYGKEIVAWASSLMGASEALDELNKSQKDFNNARFQGKKDAVSEISELKKYTSVLRDSNLPMLEREIALKKLRSQYPGYFKDLKDEELLSGNIFSALNQLNTALEKRKTLELATEYNVKNKQKFQDLDNERKALIQSIPVLEEQLKVNRELAQLNPREMSGLVTSAENQLNKAKDRRVQIDKEILSYAKAISANDAVINQYKKETILLEYTEDKQREKKAKQLREIRDLEIDQADFMAADFKYQKTILENLIANNKKTADDEKETLNDRLLAYSRYSEFKKKLVLLEYNNETKTIDKELSDQKESINKAYNEQIHDIDNALKEKTTTTAIAGEKRAQAVKEKEEAIQALEKKIFIDRNLSYENFVQKQKDLTDEWNENVPQKISDALKRLKANNAFSEEELNETKRYLEVLKEVSIASDFTAIEKDNSDKMQKIRLDRLNSERNYYVQKLTLYDKDSEEYQNYANKIIAIDKQIVDEKVKNAEKQAAIVKKNKEYVKSFADEFAQNSGFSKLFDLIENFDTLKESGVATALAISEAFQEAFNTISNASQANFDREFERLAMQKEVALKFAGESSTAKEEIERQYEEKRKAIARRQAESEKRLAIFNIAINTAQAIVSAIAESPLTFGLPFSAFAAAAGIAQIAIVQSQQIPQFWRGTDNAPEGLAWTQEKGAEVITDKNGKVKSLGNNKGAQLTYLDKGDKVLNAEKSRDYINKTLVNAGIQPMRGVVDTFSQNNSLTTDDFNAGISKLAKTMQSNKGNNTQVFLNNKQINTDSLRGIGQKV